jgi:N-methylhydantoinase A
LQMSTVLVPPAPGVFSALGLLFSDIEREFLQTLFRHAQDLRAEEAEMAYRRLEETALGVLVAEGHDKNEIGLRRLADIRYAGQAYELTVSLPAGAFDLDTVVGLFHAEHERTYGYRSEADRVELVNVKVLARVASAGGRTSWDLTMLREGGQAQLGRRKAYFGRAGGLIETPVIARADLAKTRRDGPLIVEEYDSTCLVPPGASARLDGLGNIVIDVGSA